MMIEGIVAVDEKAPVKEIIAIQPYQIDVMRVMQFPKMREITFINR